MCMQMCFHFFFIQKIQHCNIQKFISSGDTQHEEHISSTALVLALSHFHEKFLIVKKQM